MDKAELAFDPLFIREQKKPPSLFGRYLLISIILLICTLFAALFVFSLDIVVKTRGIVVSDKNNLIVNAGVDGLVKEVLVHQGQVIEAGQALFTISNSELSKNLQQTQFEQHQNRAVLADINTITSTINRFKSQTEYPSLAAFWHSKFDDNPQAQQSSLIIESFNTLIAQLDEIEQSSVISQVRVRGNRKKIEFLRKDQDFALKMVGFYQQSVEQQLSPIILLLEHENEVNQITSAIAAAQDEIAIIEEQINLSQLTSEKLIKEFELQLAKDKFAYSLNLNKLDKDLAHFHQIKQTMDIRADMNGVIQQLSEINAGMYIVSGQNLLTIVPDGGQLEVDVWVESKDIGFIEPGQPAIIKVDAFSFGKYGAVYGVLDYVSKDIFELAPSEYAYKATIRIDTESQTNTELNIIPGMTVTAELVTGRRKAYEFFYRPTTALLNDSFKER